MAALAMCVVSLLQVSTATTMPTAVAEWLQPSSSPNHIIRTDRCGRKGNIMSVPKSKRSHGRLEALTKARAIKNYTLQVCTNEKNFPKRYRWCITNNIVEETTEICRKIVRANAIRVVNIDDYNRRILFQKEAYELTEVLLEDIDTAYTFFHLTSNRVEYWTAEIEELQKLLKGWMRSDAERYKGCI